MSLVRKISEETKFEKYLMDELGRKHDENQALLKQLNQLQKEKEELSEKCKRLQRQNKSLQRSFQQSKTRSIERTKELGQRHNRRQALRDLQAEETIAFHAYHEVAHLQVPFHHLFEDETAITVRQRDWFLKYDKLERDYHAAQNYIKMCRQGGLLEQIQADGWNLLVFRVQYYVCRTVFFISYHPEGDWQPGDDREYYCRPAMSNSPRAQNIVNLLYKLENMLDVCGGHMNLCVDDILRVIERTRPLTDMEQNARVFYRNLNNAYKMDGGSAGAHVGKLLRQTYGIMPHDMSIFMDFLFILRFDESRLGTFNGDEIPFV